MDNDEKRRRVKIEYDVVIRQYAKANGETGSF